MTAPGFDPPPGLRPALAAVDDLPFYPLSATDRLDGNHFVKWNTARWLASRTFKLMGWEAQGMHRALFDLCQTETPVGTLPDDDRELAVMLRVPTERMRELRAMDFGPLRNWRRCRVDGGAVRLFHPVVLEQVQDALDRRATSQLSKEQKAVAMRRDRLVKGLRAQGVIEEALADPVLISRMDDWIEANHRGRRTEAVYRSALLHAVQSRWMMGAAVQ